MILWAENCKWFETSGAYSARKGVMRDTAGTQAGDA